MQGMQILNVDGCGVCKKIDWGKKERQDQKWDTGWRRLLRPLVNLFNNNKKKKELPWCTVHNKFVDPMYKCMQYSPKPKLLIWGASQDEEITVTKFDMRG